MQKQHPYAILIGPIWRWSLWKPNTAELCGWMNSKKAIFRTVQSVCKWCDSIIYIRSNLSVKGPHMNFTWGQWSGTVRRNKWVNNWKSQSHPFNSLRSYTHSSLVAGVRAHRFSARLQENGCISTVAFLCFLFFSAQLQFVCQTLTAMSCLGSNTPYSVFTFQMYPHV